MTDGSRRSREGYAPDGLEWKSVVACARYADDLCMISRYLCRSCMAQVTDFIYPSWLTWEVAKGSASVQPWLDITWEIHGDMAVAGPKKLDLPYLLSEADAPAKFVLPPFLGSQHVDHDALRSRVLSCLSRWEQVGMLPETLVRALVGELAMWLRSGYPCRLIVHHWSHQCRCPEVGKMTRLLLQPRA